MITTRIAVAAVAVAAAIAGPTAAALACPAAGWNMKERLAEPATVQRAPQASARARRVQASPTRTWQDELVRHRFH